MVKMGKGEVEMDSVGEEVSLWEKMMKYPDSWAEGTLPLRSTMEKPKGKWGQQHGPETELGEAVEVWDKCEIMDSFYSWKLIRPQAGLLQWTYTKMIGCEQTHSSSTCRTLNICSHLHTCLPTWGSSSAHLTTDWCRKCAKASQH